MLLPVIMLSACGRDDDYYYALSRMSVNRIFESVEQRFVLPNVVTNDPDWQLVSWGVGESSLPSNPVAALGVDEEGNQFYSLRLIDALSGVRRASTALIATVHGSMGEITLHYTVNVTDLLTDELTHISSSKHGHINYAPRGIGRNRVFGLRDMVLPSDGNVTAGNFVGNDWVDGTWRDVEFVNSSSTFQLAWNYRGAVTLDVWIEELDANNNFVRLLEENYSENNIARVVYNPNECVRTITVNFMNTGVIRVVAESAGQTRPGFRPRYEFVYEIVDAVNTYDFNDIRLLERLARYTYISDGVRFENGQFQTRVDGTQIRGANYRFDNLLNRYRTLGDYLVPNSNPNGLLSAHFRTTLTHTPNNYLNATPIGTDGPLNWARDAQTGAFRDSGSFFDEFYHWSPSFRFQDIVIRSTDRNPTVATQMNGRMETWAEGTWFFGNVFGNGYQLDATPYTRPTDNQGNYIEGRYRNTHSMRGLVTSYDCLHGYDSLGFEGRRFFPGYGWGDIFIFYMLSNNSILDNITLTGENIPQGPTAIRLNQYNKIGVLGTSMLLGQERAFSLGRAHDAGIFHNGLYIEGITIQNSIVEKGLTLIGAGFAPNVNNPIRVDTNVLRFGGFTGILGQSFGAGIGMADPENGYAVRNAPAEYSLSIRRDSYGVPYPQGYQPVHPNPNGGNFGNFVVARNNIFHDISVSPLLTMPSQSGSHISIEGNDNHFFTWLRSNDIQFPEMTDPAHEGVARIAGQSINGMIPPLLNRVFNNNNGQGIPNIDDRGHSHGGNWRTWQYTYRARYEQQHGVFLVNIPVIVVTDEGQQKNNFFTFENSVLNPATERAIGLVTDHTRSIGAMPPTGLNQRFDLIMLHSPERTDPSIGLVGVSEMNTVGINARIAEMTPAGTRVATITSRSVVNFDNGLNTTGEITLMSATDASLIGHRIELNGRVVPSVFDATTNSKIVQIQDMITAGVNGFGIFHFDLINMATRSREPVSRFNIIFQGTVGGDVPNVTAGTVGFVEDERYIHLPFNIQQGDSILNVTLMGDEMFPQNRNLDFVFDGRYVKIEGNQLRNGENRLSVQTQFMTLMIAQSVIRESIGIEAMPVDLVTHPAFVMNLIGNIDMQGIAVNIGGVSLTSAQFIVTNSRSIYVPNNVVREILGDRYVGGTNADVVITNARGLNLTTNLMVIDERSEFFFATNAITTPFNFAAGMSQSFINIAPGHRHFTEVHIELINFAGENILGVSFADTACEIEAREEIVRVTDVEGFRVDSLPHGNSRLVVPAAAVFEAGVQAGRAYRIWIFSSLHSARTYAASHQQLKIFNENHSDGLGNTAPQFTLDNFVVNLEALDSTGEGARIGLENDVYLLDVLPMSIESVSDIMPLLELGGIELPEGVALLLELIVQIENGMTADDLLEIVNGIDADELLDIIQNSNSPIMQLIVPLLKMIRENDIVSGFMPPIVLFVLDIVIFVFESDEMPDDLGMIFEIIDEIRNEIALPNHINELIDELLLYVDCRNGNCDDINCDKNPKTSDDMLLVLLLLDAMRLTIYHEADEINVFFGFMREAISFDPITFKDSNDFSESTFSATGSVFAIRNARGQILYEASRDDIFNGNSLVSFILEEGLAGRVDPRWITAIIPFLNDLEFPIPDDVLEVIGAFFPILLTREIPIPMEVPLEGSFVTGFILSYELLTRLGQGEFTIEVRNNFNISFTTLTIF